MLVDGGEYFGEGVEISRSVLDVLCFLKVFKEREELRLWSVFFFCIFLIFNKTFLSYLH